MVLTMGCCAPHFAGDGLFDWPVCTLKNTVGDTTSLQSRVLYRWISIGQWEFWPVALSCWLSPGYISKCLCALSEVNPLSLPTPPTPPSPLAPGTLGYWLKAEYAKGTMQCMKRNINLPALSPDKALWKVRVNNGYWVFTQLRNFLRVPNQVGKRSVWGFEWSRSSLVCSITVSTTHNRAIHACNTSWRSKPLYKHVI